MRSKVNFWLALFLLAIAPAFAQAPDAGKIHGHAQDPANAPLANMQVQLSTRRQDYEIHLYHRSEWRLQRRRDCPGTYVATLVQPPDKIVDRFDNVKITNGRRYAAGFRSQPARVHGHTAS